MSGSDVTTRNLADVGDRDAPKELVAITSSVTPYIYDLPQLMSLPSGFEFRFRYRPLWIEERVLQRPSDFVMGTITILFHSLDRKCLIPMRRGIVTNIETIGPFVYVQ